MEPNKENSAGPVVAIIIVLAIVILGGVYFLGQRKTSDETNMQQALENGNVDEVTRTISTQSSSDDTSSIQSDLDETNTTSLDSGVSGL